MRSSFRTGLSLTSLARVGARTTGRSLATSLLTVAWLILPAIATAASPSPTRPSSTDTRSPLEGPGFVGAPLAAIATVLLIALVAITVTTIYVRLTGRSGAPPPLN